MARSWIIVAFLGLAFGCSTNSASGPESDAPLGPNSARTAFAALGSAHPFTDYDAAGQEVGWRVLRSVGSEWGPVGRAGGIIETFPDVGLPQVRVAYAFRGRDLGVARLIQGPEVYRLEGDGRIEDATIGQWVGQWYEYESAVGFVFPTGESVEGLPVMARVFVNLEDNTADELRALITSLTFGE